MTNAKPYHTLTIRVLYSEDCPGGEASVRVLHEALAQTAPGTEIEAVELSPREFSELGTPGSPTILVNGGDLFPAGEGPAAAASCCRLYATPEGLKCHPTAGMLKDALRGSGVGGATAPRAVFIASDGRPRSRSAQMSDLVEVPDQDPPVRRA